MRLVTSVTSQRGSHLGIGARFWESNFNLELISGSNSDMGTQPQTVIVAPEALLYLRSQSVVSRQIAGETLVVPIRGKVGDLASIYSFNETGSLLWNALEQPRTLDSLSLLLCQTYGVDWDHAQQDATSFMQEMREAGLIATV